MVEPEEEETPLPSEKSEISVKEIKDRYTAGLKPLRSEHFNYWLNFAYLTGDQWLWYNRGTKAIEQIASDDTRVQATVNHMWPASRTILAKLVQKPLTFYVPPSAADDAHLKAARTSESILVDLTREHDWEGIREDSLWAAWKGGTSAISICWDASKGHPLGMTEDGRNYGTGDTVEDVLAITDFVIEPGARDGEHARWWIKNVAMPPEQIQDQWDLSWLPAADASAATSPFQKKLIQMDLYGDGDALTPLTNVYTLYERPNNLCKAGQIVTVVNDRIIEQTDWDFPFEDRLNLVLIRETRIENSWVGQTVLKAARPIQNGINQSWSSIIEHMKLAGNARLMLPESMIDTIDEFTDLPGEIIPFPDNAGKAGYLTPPVMPNWWVEEPDRLRSEMDDVLGVHEVSRGDAPGRVESGLAISILVEQDATPIGRLTKESAGAFSRLAEMALRLYEKHVKETRQAVVKSPGQPPRNYGWTGKDLMGQVVAEVPVDEIMPRSRAAQEAFAQQALQSGLIKTLPEYYKLAEIPVGRDILEALSPDVAKARRENASMTLGRVEVPEDFDDHITHIEEHHVQMKSGEWDLMDDKTREVFRHHIKAHENMAAAEMGRQRAKTEIDPALAAAASATGAPLIPMDEVPGGPPPTQTMPLQPQPMQGPGGEDESIAALVASQNPGVPAGVVESELGPIG